MKKGKQIRFGRRVLSMILASVTILSLVVFAPPKAEALRVQPGQNMMTTTNLVIWDWITDMQSVGANADYSNPDAKYSRIMMYHLTGGDRYYFNGHGRDVKAGDEDKVYVDEYSRIGHSSHKEWNQDLVDGDHFVTVGGERTLYIKYNGTSHDYHSWKLFMADKTNDARTAWALCLADKYDKLYTIEGINSGEWGGKDTQVRGWIINKTAHVVPQSRWATYDHHVIWQWDNDTGGYDDALEFDLSDRKFRAWDIDTGGCDEFRIYLGAEHAVPTLSENFTVQADQITTLGRPLFYIPKGVVVTVKNEGVLTVDGMLLNDGEIVVEDGGLLILKDGAKIMPLTKYDNNCGKITSSGSIVVEENALLCGGAVNGIRIKGGGVVNYGVIAAEDFYVGENYAIENRGESWVFAGQSPTRAARLRYIMEAVANEGVTKVADPKADFGKIASVKSNYNIPANGIYGGAAANVVKSGEEAVGSADDPTLTVYVKNTPSDQKDEVLFKDVKMDRVSLRVSGDTATYTADGKTYTIRNKLVSATIGRGSGSEVLFRNMWVGALDGAWVQLEPALAPGMRLALNSGSANNGTSVILWTANDDMDKWWHITKAGTAGGNQTYYIDNGKSTGEARGLDISGVDSVSDGDSVYLYKHDGGNDQKWIIVPVSGNYNIRNAANQNVSLAIKDANPKNGSAVNVQTNSANAPAQRWNMVNLFSEDAYAESVAKGSALEFIPQSATEKRMTVSVTERTLGVAEAGTVSLQAPADGGSNQRWRLVPVGTDNLDGASAVFYRIVEAESNLSLEVQGEVKSDAAVAARYAESGIFANKWWYLQEAAGVDTYYVAARSNSGLVLTAGSSSMTLSVNAKASNQMWMISGVSAAKEEAERAVADSTADPLDGKTFTLSPKHAQSMVAGVKDKSDANGANVELQAGPETLYQQWTFTQVGNDTLDGTETACYTIENKGSGKVFDLPGDANAKSGQSVSQYDTDGYADQEWFAVEDGEGYYTIVNHNNKNICLDVSGSGTTAGSNIQAYTKNGGNNQKWKLTAAKEIDRFDGKVFYLSPKHAGSDMVLDLCGNGTADQTQVQIYKKAETEIQRWKFERLGFDYLDGVKYNYYAIHSVYADGKALDTSGETKNGARPHLWTYNVSNKNQQWYVQDAGEGYYYVIPRSDTTKYLGVQSSNTANNSVVELWDSNGDNRKWKLTETIAPETMGTFQLESVGKSGVCIDLQHDNSDNGTWLVTWAARADNHSRWSFVKMGTDSKGAYYRIVNKSTGKAMDVKGNNDAQENAYVCQYTYDFYDDQLWYLNKAGSDEHGDFYYIENRNNSKLRLAAENAKYDNGTYIILTTGTGDNAKWRLNEDFEPVDLGTYEFGMNDSAYANMRMIVQGGFKDDGRNIIAYHRHTSNSEAGAKLMQFKITQRGSDVVDGVRTPYYSIENTNSGKVLDPPGTADVSDGTNVQQYSYDGYSDQHWYMEVRTDNSVVFRNRANSTLVLAATGTSDDDSIKLKTYDAANIGRQSWQLHPIMQTNDKGQCYIPGNANAAKAGIPFAKAEDVMLNPPVGGKYTLTPQHAKSMRMDLAGGNTSNGTAIQLYTNVGNSNQRWQLVPMGIDYYDGGGKIFYKLAFGGNANKVAETRGYGPIAAPLNIQLWDYDGAYDQLWYLEQAATGGGSDDVYYLIGRGTMSGTDKICLGVPNGATKDATQLQTATLRNRNYQQWQLEQTD